MHENGEEELDEFFGKSGNHDLDCHYFPKPDIKEILQIPHNSILILGRHVNIPGQRAISKSTIFGKVLKIPLSSFPANPILEAALTDMVLGQNGPKLSALLQLMHQEHHHILILVDRSKRTHHYPEFVVYYVDLLTQGGKRKHARPVQRTHD